MKIVLGRPAAVLSCVLVCGLVAATVAAAARPPTHAEREAIVKALPGALRKTPVECVWLDIRVSRNPRYAFVASEYLNSTGPRSRCVQYARDGFFVLRRTTRWKVVYSGSDWPRCSLGVPRDLVRCLP